MITRNLCAIALGLVVIVPLMSSPAAIAATFPAPGVVVLVNDMVAEKNHNGDIVCTGEFSLHYGQMPSEHPASVRYYPDGQCNIAAEWYWQREAQPYDSAAVIIVQNIMIDSFRDPHTTVLGEFQSMPTCPPVALSGAAWIMDGEEESRWVFNPAPEAKAFYGWGGCGKQYRVWFDDLYISDLNHGLAVIAQGTQLNPVAGCGATEPVKIECRISGREWETERLLSLAATFGPVAPGTVGEFVVPRV